MELKLSNIWENFDEFIKRVPSGMITDGDLKLLVNKSTGQLLPGATWKEFLFEILDYYRWSSNGGFKLFDYKTQELKEIKTALNDDTTLNALVDNLIVLLEGQVYNGIVFGSSDEDIVLESSMNNQQTVEEAVQQAKSEGSYKTRNETDNQAAKRMNISVPELLTLRGLKEKDRLALKKEMNTKDKAGKNAKTKVVKFVTFNENFDKGFVSLEYPKLKGWLPISMGASEFFRKTNTKVRKLTAAEAKAQQVADVDKDADDFDENAWEEMNATKGFENPYSLEGYGGTDDLSSDSGTNPTLNTQQVATQQFIEQKIQEAQTSGDIVAPKVIKEETEAAKAKRMNLTVPQMKTLMSIKEKDRLALKTPMSTKDKTGKSAKTKVMKFVSFNDKFSKGQVFLEYPHMKGWLVTSMGASEFFRKFNVRLKSA